MLGPHQPLKGTKSKQPKQKAPMPLFIGNVLRRKGRSAVTGAPEYRMDGRQPSCNTECANCTESNDHFKSVDFTLCEYYIS